MGRAGQIGVGHGFGGVVVLAGAVVGAGAGVAGVPMPGIST